MSKQMIRTLARADQRSGDPVYLKPSGQSRFAQHLLTVSGEKYLPLQKGRIFQRAAGDKDIYCSIPPGRNAEAARKVSELVRTCGYRYGEIAVITGNLEEICKTAAQVFEERIFHILLTRSIRTDESFCGVSACCHGDWQCRAFLMRAFSVISDAGCQKLPENRLDKLENYVLAQGIRGI